MATVKGGSGPDRDKCVFFAKTCLLAHNATSLIVVVVVEWSAAKENGKNTPIHLYFRKLLATVGSSRNCVTDNHTR